MDCNKNRIVKVEEKEVGMSNRVWYTVETFRTPIWPYISLFIPLFGWLLLLVYAFDNEGRGNPFKKKFCVECSFDNLAAARHYIKQGSIYSTKETIIKN